MKLNKLIKKAGLFVKKKKNLDEATMYYIDAWKISSEINYFKTELLFKQMILTATLSNSLLAMAEVLSVIAQVPNYKPKNPFMFYHLLYNFFKRMCEVSNFYLKVFAEKSSQNATTDEEKEVAEQILDKLK